MVRTAIVLLAGVVLVGWYLGMNRTENRDSRDDIRLAGQNQKGMNMDSQTAIFAAGCFWGVEATFRAVPGVVDTRVGYTGGSTTNPTYREVCTGRTGHAEAVRVTFDPAVVSYERLVEVFFSCHDPTTLNRQGPDIGTQYRSAIFYDGESQRENAAAVLQTFKENNPYQREVVTQLEPAGEFYLAEDYHQQYLEKRGMNACQYKVGD